MKQKGLETVVGFFVVLGLGVIGGLILTFGNLKERFDSSYVVTVEFPNASGLLQGSKVYYAGAKIGRVLDSPEPIKDGTAVQVILRLTGRSQVRSDAKFVVGSSGLLGDRFVDVQSRVGSTAEFLKNGDRVVGSRSSGIEDLTADARPAIEKVNHILSKLDKDVLTPETIKDLRESIAKLNSVMGKADSALTKLDALLAKAQKGEGPIPRMLTDKSISDDLAAFIKNLRKNGVLFYSDDTEDVGAALKKNEKTLEKEAQKPRRTR
jgi:phospholipid/cholesterol/gamma-HCH transport system substrate-binding protein